MSAPELSVGVRAAQKLAELARRRIELIGRRESLRAFLPALRAAETALRERLARYAGTSTFSEAMARGYQLQIRTIAAYLADSMGATLPRLMGAASRESLAAMERELNTVQRAIALSHAATSGGAVGGGVALGVIPVREVARLVGAVEGDTSLLAHFAARSRIAAKRYSAQVVASMEGTIAKGLLTGQSPTAIAHELVSGESKLGGAYWRAERIGRTEVSHAFNVTHVEAGKRVAEEYDDTLMRWTEFCDDDTGEPLDNRVADDSIAMHGQLRRPGEPFRDEEHDADADAPPNRPNDRATLVVWRAAWGEPPGGLERLDARSQEAYEEALQSLSEAA